MGVGGGERWGRWEGDPQQRSVWPTSSHPKAQHERGVGGRGVT